MYIALAQLAAQGNSLYQQKRNSDAMQAERERQIRVNTALAAEALAITYNSILRKSMEAGMEAKRQAFDIQVKTRQAEGAALVSAATSGVAGRRADLVRDMAIRGGSERAMTRLEQDSKNAQDALIEQADLEERSIVNRLISTTPDTIAGVGASDVLNTVTSAVNTFGEYRQRNPKTAGVQDLIPDPTVFPQGRQSL